MAEDKILGSFGDEVLSMVLSLSGNDFGIHKGSIDKRVV